METETRKYAYPFNLRVDTSGMKGVVELNRIGECKQ